MNSPRVGVWRQGAIAAFCLAVLLVAPSAWAQTNFNNVDTESELRDAILQIATDQPARTSSPSPGTSR